MRPQRKIMMVETTHAFVKLKQIKAAVSAGGIKFQNPAMLDRLDPVGVSTSPLGRTILHGGGDAPDVIHQVFVCSFQLKSFFSRIIKCFI